VQDFITKPFDFREFTARIEQQVRWRRLLDARGTPTATVAVPVSAAPPQAPGLSYARELAARGEHERALAEAMSVAEEGEAAAKYQEAAEAYAVASESAKHVRNPDVANKLQRLSGKMYLLLAENATDTATIHLGYMLSAKMFLTAGNLKLAGDVRGRA
jgi:DNA-binding response OmpR family regulator